MAVSKRLRYEIFRRDNHACRYCGAHAPDVELTVDHVVPEALGGSDQPDNLVTACRDCNGGKSASSPDAAVVADVEQDAMRWAAAMKEAAAIQAGLIAEGHARAAAFLECWSGWGDDITDALPADWERTVEMWHRASVSQDEMEYAVHAAMTKSNLRQRDLWKYTCGVVWRKLEERQALARELLDRESETLRTPIEPILEDAPEHVLVAVDRYLELCDDHPQLNALEEEAWEIVRDVRRCHPEMDLVEVWYGYPNFREHYGQGIKHRLLAYTNAHDFDDKDESLCYQTLIENLRYAWQRLTV